MALENQINLYSVDTGNFYTKKEKYLHDKNAKIRIERKIIVKKIKDIKKMLKKLGYTDSNIENITHNKLDEINIIHSSRHLIDELNNLNKLKTYKNLAANSIKDKLIKTLKNKINSKENQKSKVTDIRVLNKESISEKNVISLFESDFTRMIRAKKDELTEDIIVVQVYYFDVFKDIFLNGFYYKGEKYKYYTSSAGQIRKKKAVFIKESTWNKHEKTMMCGLTIEKINKKGGNNVNKHLAYMALTNSATDEWLDFDIDKTIVVDDFETDVFGEYDLISDSDYSITRTKGYVPIPHTDGAGMILPYAFGKKQRNAMVRLSCTHKGLLGVFDFFEFIKVNNCSPIIKDIYGKEYNVIEEEIQVIFTKSQFKMYKYYESWDEYKKYFKKYNCKAGLCNIEEERIPNSRLNYQVLQTLTSATDEDIEKISKKSVDRLLNMCSSIENMQNIFGVSPYNINMTPLQEAIKIYPNIMNDVYFKDIIKNIKNSLVKKYKSAKLEIKGKYTFILPDFYAACEYWFLKNKNPDGLLSDGEVSCSLFKNCRELDCLRSPHLYKEHAIRKNAICTEDESKKELLSKWFNTKAIYTSCKDLISKILQFDVDGDRSLVIGDENIIDLAKRSMEGIVPLYYNMKKAEPTELNSKNIYNGLITAFTGGNIGIYSNNISKIWNSDIFVNGTKEEKQKATDIIKILCMENNYVIDYAKTLYKPERPKHINKQINEFTKQSLPYFFIYAKDKDVSQVYRNNKSIVNKLDEIIPNPRINTRKINLGELDYKLLMNNVDILIDNELVEKYKELSNTYHFKISMKDEYQNNLHYLACEIREELSMFGYSNIEIADMLIKTLYSNKSRYKELLWFCYGKQIVKNLKKNIPINKTKTIQCSECEEWFEVNINNGMTCRCSNCAPLHKKERDRLRKQKYRMSH